MPLVETFSFLKDIPTHTLAEELKKRAGVEWVRIGAGNAVCFDQSGPALVLMVHDGQEDTEEPFEDPEMPVTAAKCPLVQL